MQIKLNNTSELNKWAVYIWGGIMKGLNHNTDLKLLVSAIRQWIRSYALKWNVYKANLVAWCSSDGKYPVLKAHTFVFIKDTPTKSGL